MSNVEQGLEKINCYGYELSIIDMLNEEILSEVIDKTNYWNQETLFSFLCDFLCDDMDDNYNTKTINNGWYLSGFLKRGNIYKINFSEYSVIILYTLNKEKYGFDAVYTTHPILDDELELKTNKHLKFNKISKMDMSRILSRRYICDQYVNVEIVKIDHNDIDLLQKLKIYVKDVDIVGASKLLNETNTRILKSAHETLIKAFDL